MRLGTVLLLFVSATVDPLFAQDASVTPRGVELEDSMTGVQSRGAEIRIVVPINPAASFDAHRVLVRVTYEGRSSGAVRAFRWSEGR